MIELKSAPHYTPEIKFSMDSAKGSKTFGILARENGASLKFVLFDHSKSNEYQTIESYHENSDSQEDVLKDIQNWIFEICEGETEEDSNICDEIAKSALAIFFMIYAR